MRQALNIAEQVVEERLNDATSHAAVADILIKLAGLYEETGRLAQVDSILCQARESLDKSRQLQPTLDSEHSGLLAPRYEIGQMESQRKWLHMALNAFCGASQAWQLMVLHELELPDFPYTLMGSLAALTVIYHQVGQEKLDTDDPQGPFYYDHLAYFLYNFGLALEYLDLPGQAKDAYGRAISTFEPLAREYPAVPEYGMGLRLAQSGMGRMAWLLESDSYGWKRYPKLACRAAV